MSKKNNQNTRRKQHAFDLQREAAVKKKTADKAAAKQKALAAKPKQLKKGKKAKGIRIRKNVVVAVWLEPRGILMRCLVHVLCCSACYRERITPLPDVPFHGLADALKGIKVKDAASKRAAREAVKERRQVAGMEVDDE
jgi:hypothetical protein